MTGLLEPWSDFNVAMTGATAALAGLLIVAMSVNMKGVLEGPTLPARAAAAIAVLVLALTVSCLGLVPGQPIRTLGLVVLVLTAAGWAFQVHAIRVILHDPQSPPGARVLKSVVGMAPLAAYSTGAVLLLTESAAGLVLTAVGSILAIVGAVLFAWIVLVEILR